jgi:arabinose-5-phosphate isomerase
VLNTLWVQVKSNTLVHFYQFLAGCSEMKEQFLEQNSDVQEPLTPIRDTTLMLARTVIAKEAIALDNLAKVLDTSFVSAVQLILDSRGRVIVMGVGKSGLVGRKLAASLASLGTPSLFVHAADAAHGDLGMITSADVILIISYSGESDEIRKLFPSLMQLGCPLIAITGQPNSSLARNATVHLDTGVREEADPRGLAPTTSTTTALALGDALALALAEAHHFAPDAFIKRHPGGSLGQRVLDLSLDPTMQNQRKGCGKARDETAHS